MQGSAGLRIEVEPEVLMAAGRQLGNIGRQLGFMSDAFNRTLEIGIPSGWDPAGLDFGINYGKTAQAFARAFVGAANSFQAVGYMLEASGRNYKNADAVSTIGGTAAPESNGPVPSERTPASVPSGPSGFSVPPPTKWMVIQPFLVVTGGGLWAASLWPSGHPGLLDAISAQWANIAKGLGVFDNELATLQTAVSGQQIPEMGLITVALVELITSLGGLKETASKEAKEISDFAKTVDTTQNAIRRLLNQLSSDGVVDVITGIFTGDDEGNLQQIIDDVSTVLDSFQREVKGVVGLLSSLVKLINDAADAFEKWARVKLVEAFGDDVGNALADGLTAYTDFEVGLVTGLINTVSGTVALLDADTWKGMYNMALGVAKDPSTLDDVLLQMGKDFIAYDKWSGDHPGRAAGEAGFNIGLLFMPGGAASKTGTIAKSLSYGSKLIEEGRLPRLTDLPGLRNRAPEIRGLPGGGHGLPDVPEIRPGHIPDSVVTGGPHAPDRIDAPTAPRDLTGPAGPPDPPGPHTTHGDGGQGGGGGGSGPPPDHPGRPVGPADAGPSHSDGPTSQSPSSGSPTAPHVSEPSAPSHAPSTGDTPSPGTQHTPEPSTPAGSHDTRPSESPTPQTDHAPKTHDAPSEAHTPSQHGGEGGPADHSPRTHDSGAVTDGPTHSPVEHQPAHTPSTESPGAHERPSTDAGQHREQSHTPNEPAASQPQAPASTPGVMGTPMGGTPMGGGHTPSTSHAPGTAHTPNAESQGRGSESKTPQSGPAEKPRAPSPSAAGPEPGKSPSPPVKATVSPHVSESTGEPRRPEAHTPRPGDGPAGASGGGGEPPHGGPPSGPPDGPPNGSGSSQPGDSNDPYDSDHDNGSAQESPDDGRPPPLHREHPYPHTGGILPRYVGEHLPTGHFGPPGVKYLDDAERDLFRVTIQNGLVHDAAGDLLDTSSGVSAFGAHHAGRAIFVMDEHGNLYASTFHRAGAFHHSTFFAGGDVASAGEIVVRDGRIELLTDSSGHYQPNFERTQQVLDQLASQGIHLSPSQIHITPRGPGTP